jgi:hypothetical protein
MVALVVAVVDVVPAWWWCYSGGPHGPLAPLVKEEEKEKQEEVLGLCFSFQGDSHNRVFPRFLLSFLVRWPAFTHNS